MFEQRLVRHVAALAGAVLLLGGSAAAVAAKSPTFQAPIFNAAGKPVGIARFIGVDTGGVQVFVQVHDLPPGMHGMHLHEFGSCNTLRDTQGNPTPFGAAGGHFDPDMTKMHKGPDGGGHAGDLPMLSVDASGAGSISFFAAGLHVSGANSIVGRSLMIHANPDNFTDTPPNGGSGARIACGEIGASY